MAKYKHIFFDLDRTLWDLNTNAHEALQEVYAEIGLKDKGIDDFEGFYKAYQYHNDKLWEDYRQGRIVKERLRTLRFKLALEDFNISSNSLAEQMGQLYVLRSPSKSKLVPHAKEVLDYLQEKKYQLHIITNGFSEVQDVKMKNSGIYSYFKRIITSEAAGVNKPDAKIFRYALKAANAGAGESLMIGDHLEVDIVGAREAGIDQVYFNPEKIDHQEVITKEIYDLIELKEWL